jgi:hypothetical protein
LQQAQSRLTNHDDHFGKRAAPSGAAFALHLSTLRIKSEPDGLLDVAEPTCPIAELPPPNVGRWTIRRKAAIVLAVATGVLSRAAAGGRYKLSEEELLSWQQIYAAYGSTRSALDQTQGVSAEIASTKLGQRSVGFKRRQSVCEARGEPPGGRADRLEVNYWLILCDRRGAVIVNPSPASRRGSVEEATASSIRLWI